MPPIFSTITHDRSISEHSVARFCQMGSSSQGKLCHALSADNEGVFTAKTARLLASQKQTRGPQLKVNTESGQHDVLNSGVQGASTD